MPQQTHSAFLVSGLCCTTEEDLIRRKIARLKGVETLSFNTVSHRLDVVHSCDETVLLSALENIGLPGKTWKETATPRRHVRIEQLISTILSGTFLALGLSCSLLSVDGIVPLSAFLLSIGFGGWPVAIRAFLAVKNLTLDMNVLMTLAVVGALAIGHSAEGAAVIVLFALSLLLESMSLDRSLRAIHSLLELSPTTASIRTTTGSSTVPATSVAVGDVILVRPGDRIPLDGVVLTGTSWIDQSSVTGEPLPVMKSPGDMLFAGTLNGRGALEVTVTKPANASTISTIARLVEDALRNKAPSQTLVERFARIYTPIVFLLALMVMTIPPLVFQAPFDDWFYRALVLLVIACPCALVISTPVTMISALTRAARLGVLVKGSAHLERLSSVRAVALDKTGTLTTGIPTITDVIAMGALSSREIIRIAAILELRSEHHLAGAFLRKAHADGIDIEATSVDAFDSLTGKGITARVNRKTYAVGNHSFVEELGLCSPALEARLQSLERQGKTAVVLADETTAVGVIGIADTLREESARVVGALHDEGVSRVVLLTGDNKGAAESIAQKLEVDDVHYELLPDQKLSAIRDLQSVYGSVAMVGDGLNDAPALALADVGIAMGGAGSDTALRTADIVLMSDALENIPMTIRIGKQALSIIRQNIVFALSIKLVFLTLGVMGLSGLWLAILADDGATLLVILNSLRLLRPTHLP